MLAGALTPTDAGLGAPTILHPDVPNRIKRALNVESGLNDGLATPVVLFALSMLLAGEGEETPALLQISLVPVVLAVIMAVVLGLVVAWGLDWSKSLRMSSGRGRSIAVLALPLLLWGAAELIGANGFVAAFVGGMAFGARSMCLHDDGESAELLETTADLLSFVVWFLAGGLSISFLMMGFDWRWLVIAVLALTVLRAVPVAISLIGSGLQVPSVVFIAWFGPRGLATIVFALLAVEELGPDAPEVTAIVGVTMTTVVLSVFAHGITALPFAEKYGRWSKSHDLDHKHPELAPKRTRGRHARMHSN